MTKEETVRQMIRELEAAGWTFARNNGRHTVYRCPSGRHTIPVPTSHGKISAGVVRKIRAAIARCGSCGQEG